MEPTPSDVHHDNATKIVQVLSDHNSNPIISKEVAQFVLKELLESNMSIADKYREKMPEKWYKEDNETLQMTNELAAYFRKINFKASLIFFSKLEKKFMELKRIKQEEDAKKQEEEAKKQEEEAKKQQELNNSQK
jgi:hypothetical protein